MILDKYKVAGQHNGYSGTPISIQPRFLTSPLSQQDTGHRRQSSHDDGRVDDRMDEREDESEDESEERDTRASSRAYDRDSVSIRTEGGAKKKELVAGSTDDILAKTVFRKRKTMTELVVTAPLTGVASMAFLAANGFNNVDTLRFSPGTITALEDVPHTVRKIVIAHNALASIAHLPNSLEYLDAQSNCLGGGGSGSKSADENGEGGPGGPVDVSRYSSLTYLNVDRNRITEFSVRSGAPFPETLYELHAAYNRLTELRLGGAPLLHTIDVSYNPPLTVFDLPDGITSGLFPETVVYRTTGAFNTSTSTSTSTSTPSPLNRSDLLATERADRAAQIDIDAYVVALTKFFRARQKYEVDSAKSKSGKHPPCPGCGRTGGLVFVSKSEKHMAYCASTPPCDWHITVNRGNFKSVRELMADQTREIDVTRTQIIRQKMDTLFEYITEEKSAELFAMQMKYYTEASGLAENYTAKWNSVYWNEGKADVIHQKQKQVQEYLAQVSQEIQKHNWEEAARIQADQIAPLTRYIQSLMYQSSTAVQTDNVVRIVQLSVTPDNAEVNIGHTVGAA